VEPSESSDAVDVAVQNLVAQGVDGLIYAAPAPAPIHAAAIESDVRTIFVNCWAENAQGAPQILADEYQGGRDAAAATFAAGHRNVVYLGGPMDDYACNERERGLVDAARDAGIDPAGIRRKYGDYNIHSGYELALDVLSRENPTALICGNDRMAVGALMAAHASRLDCPDDVSIVGFDDQPDIAEQLQPPLTTVALPHLQMGLTAGAAMLAEEEPSRRQLIPCRYIPRGSLAAPRPPR
jgi:LacI family transcriptional regulator